MEISARIFFSCGFLHMSHVIAIGIDSKECKCLFLLICTNDPIYCISTYFIT